MDWLWDLDGNILLYLQEYARMPVLNEIMRFITSLGDAGMIAIAACIVLLCTKKYRRVGVVAAVSLILEFIIVNVGLKPFVARVRPYEVIEGLKCITKIPSDFSFPSGHTGSSFAVAAVIFMKMPRKYGIAAIVTATLIAYSRLYLGVHYPTDVLAGMVIGIVTAAVSCRIFYNYFIN